MDTITAVFPLYENFDSLDVLGPYQAFFYGGITPCLAAETAGMVTSLEGVSIQAPIGFDDARQFDLLFVPGGAHLEKVLDRGPLGNNPYLDFLVRQSQNAKLICSVCTGALLLGAAGLLDSELATTHWAYKDV